MDIRELLKIQLSRPSLHEPGNRRLSVEEHVKNLTFDDNQKNPIPQSIVIFDDVITTGASFKAAQTILQKNYPTVRIVGILAWFKNPLFWVAKCVTNSTNKWYSRWVDL